MMMLPRGLDSIFRSMDESMMTRVPPFTLIFPSIGAPFRIKADSPAPTMMFPDCAPVTTVPVETRPRFTATAGGPEVSSKVTMLPTWLPSTATSSKKGTSSPGAMADEVTVSVTMKRLPRTPSKFATIPTAESVAPRASSEMAPIISIAPTISQIVERRPNVFPPLRSSPFPHVASGNRWTDSYSGGSAPEISGVDGAGQRRVIGPLDHGASIREQGDRVLLHLRDEDLVRRADLPNTAEPRGHPFPSDGLLSKRIHRHRVPPAQPDDDVPPFRVPELVGAAPARGAVLPSREPQSLKLLGPTLVDEKIPPGLFAEQDLQALGDLAGGDGGRDRVQDAGRVARRQRTGSRDLGDEATEAGGASGDDRHHHALGRDRARVDPGDVRFQAGVVHEQPGLHVVRAVEEQVDPAEEVGGVREAGGLRPGLADDLRVPRQEPLPGDNRLRAVDVALHEERLTLEVRELDDVAVDQAQVPDAGAGEQGSRHTPQGAEADHSHTGSAEALMAHPPDLREHLLAGVPGHGRRHGGGVLWAFPPPEHLRRSPTSWQRDQAVAHQTAVCIGVGRRARPHSNT